MYDHWHEFVWIVAVGITFLASFMQSLTGFGLAIIAAPLLIIIYDPKEVVLILQFISLLINLVFSIVLRKHVDWKLVRVLFLGCILGQPLGLVFYHYVQNDVLKVSISVLIIIFLIYKEMYRTSIQETQKKSLVVGMLSGILNTAMALPGPPLILYLAASQRDKVSMRATSVAYFTPMSIMAIFGFIIAGKDLSFAIEQTVMLLPMTIVGLILGHLLFPYLSQRIFQRIIVVMMIFSSGYILVSM